mmetsp:Transcript_9805/g.29871  ORF Transcript_9805/g.29871 Transcript_9805/m.29871 type:complete len:279 (-) Transcript_9805:1116-1952(-)
MEVAVGSCRRSGVMDTLWRQLLEKLRRRRLLVGLLVVGGGFGGLAWLHRERIRRLVRSLRAFGRTGYMGSCILERLSGDLYEYLEREGGDEKELPQSLQRMLTLLTRPEMLEALETIARSAAEGVARQMPKDTSGLQKILGSQEVERLAAVLMKTATREVLRVCILKFEEQRIRSSDGALIKFDPESVGKWLQVESVRTVIIEIVSTLVLATSRQNARREPHFMSKSCGRKSNSRGTPILLRRTPSSKNAAAIVDKSTEPNLAEKLIITAMQDRDLVS